MLTYIKILHLFDYKNIYKLLIVFVQHILDFVGSVILSNVFLYFLIQKLQIIPIEIAMN